MSQTRATAATGGQKSAFITDRDGLRGRIDTVAPQTREGGRPEVLVHLEDGRQAYVPVDELVLQDDGSFIFPSASRNRARRKAAKLRATAGATKHIVTPQRTRAEERIVMPVVAETLEVEKRKVQTGGVRVRKSCTSAKRWWTNR
jgi:hypothetical protein